MLVLQRLGCSTNVNCEPPQSVNDILWQEGQLLACHIDESNTAVVTQIGNLHGNCPMTDLIQGLWFLVAKINCKTAPVDPCMQHACLLTP